MTSISSASLTSSISQYVSDYMSSEKFGIDASTRSLIENPVVTVDYTAANGKTVEASSEALSAMLMMQSMIAPFAVFFLILMASQMIMTAISTEKIDKTLETLLSAPVSRITVLTAKMIAALVVALLNAAAMIIGFVFYMNGMMGGAVEQISDTAQAGTEAFTAADAMAQLGLTLTPSAIIIFGIQLFLTIAIGLSISLILGAMATDAKSVQTLVLPVTMITMIPFFVTMFADVNLLSPIPKLILYIIPFTHTYTSMNNMMFGNMGIVWGGLIYQLIFFAVCMYLAVKIFTTDLLFTMSLPVSSKSGKKHSNGGKD
ncbi:MAG: ABC transporter permease, partial [Oscillospiraceae bacterium]|nr:ABC transporter permease [Oscillospiraceae bacterium]